MPQQGRPFNRPDPLLGKAVLQDRQYTEIIAARVRELERHNATLRARISKLERSRRTWKEKAHERKLVISRLRSRVTHARRSRDMWRHRATL